MNITNDIKYVGVNDYDIDIFEGQYIVPNGMAYNSYVILDDKITVMDTVDGRFGDEWLANIKAVLGDKKPAYLIIQHMEPDHAANIRTFLDAYPDTTLISNKKAFTMMDQFYYPTLEASRQEVENGQTISLGSHNLTFVFAPMVHWPEVMVTYDSSDKVLFSADGFGKFGALDVDEEWDCEARRYYFGIVGKYGAQTQNLLKAAADLDIQIICPLHGPVLTENLDHYLKQYNTWSSYEVESEGVCVIYASMHGNTKEAAEYFADQLKANGCPKVALSDVSREDIAECVEDAFRYGKLVLASVTYNMDILPSMREFIEKLVFRNYQKRKIALIENGTWAPNANNVMKKLFEPCKDISFYENEVTFRSAIKPEDKEALDKLAKEVCQD